MYINYNIKDFSLYGTVKKVTAPFLINDTDNILLLLNTNANELTANLTTTGVTSGTYGSTTQIPVITVDNFGRITGITTTNSVLLKTNGVTNPTQATLNLKNGTNVTITDDGLGGITINSTGGGGSGTVTSVAVTPGTGISASVANPTTTPNITITNTAPDQTVSLGTTGSGLAVTGTYPNFTLQNTLPDQTVTLTAGTNINVTGTYPNFTIDSTASGGILHGTAAGTDTYTVTIAGVTSYNDGDAYLIRFTNGNTTSATLNINSIGAINLYKNNDGPLIGGDIWAGSEMLCIYNSTTTAFQCIGTSPNSLFAYVTNADSVTITKGQPVYAFGGVGDRMTVKLAYNTSDATSARTVGLVYSTSIAANQKGIIIIEGQIDGLSTVHPVNGWLDGDIVYLGATAGTITRTKPYAPNHLVYLGVVTTASPGAAGRIYVKVQNGYELEEIHDVDLISVAPTNGQVLQYVTGSPDLWKPRSIFGQIFIECNGQGGVVQPGYTGVSDVTFDGIITGWTIYSVNPSTGAALSGSIDIDILSDSSFIPTTSLFPIAANRPKLTTQTNNSATGLSIAVTQGHKIRARVISATTCVLVNLQLQVTRT